MRCTTTAASCTTSAPTRASRRTSMPIARPSARRARSWPASSSRRRRCRPSSGRPPAGSEASATCDGGLRTVARRAASPAPTATALPAATPTATAVASSDEVQRLKALGYVDVAEEPADGRSGVVKRDPAHSYPGYNLFTNAFTCSTEIIAGDGRLVHRWSREPCFRWDNTTLLPDGDLLVVGRDGKADPGRAKPGSRWRQGQYLARLAWDGRLRWERRINAHHDAELAPNGLISVLT